MGIWLFLASLAALFAPLLVIFLILSAGIVQTFDISSTSI